MRKEEMNGYLRITCMFALAVFSSCRAAETSAPSHDQEKAGVGLTIQVTEPVVLGKPFRIQGFATNHGDTPRVVRIEPSQINLELKSEEGTGIRRGGFDEGWTPEKWKELTTVPPGKTVRCFDGMVPTGLRWGAGYIIARGQARLSWRTWIRRGIDPYEYESRTVKSKSFEIHLQDPADKENTFAVKGLQVQLKPVRQEVTGRDEVSFVVKLINVSDKEILISAREKFDDNYCNFFIYAPGDQIPISQVVHWPTKGTQGFVIFPGKTVEREFKTSWGLRYSLVPSPNGHASRERKETAFVKNGEHAVVAYFCGQDNTEAQDAWTGYVRSNVVTVEVIARLKD
jgi:hypothetical protein